MSRELLILRHGKSAWDTDAPTDFERPLAKRGRKAATRMGRWLKENDLLPDLVVSSPAERARQTALRACKAAGVGEDAVAWDERIYEADVPTLLQVLAECPREKARIMIVGHNPGLEELVEHLGDGRAEYGANGKLMPTAAVARAAMPDHWARLGRGCAPEIAVARVRELEAPA